MVYRFGILRAMNNHPASPILPHAAPSAASPPAASALDTRAVGGVSGYAQQVRDSMRRARLFSTEPAEPTSAEAAHDCRMDQRIAEARGK